MHLLISTDCVPNLVVDIRDVPPWLSRRLQVASPGSWRFISVFGIFCQHFSLALTSWCLPLKQNQFFLLRSSCFLVTPQSMLSSWFPLFRRSFWLVSLFGGWKLFVVIFWCKNPHFGLHHAPSTFPTIRESGSLDRSAWESPSTTEVFPSFADQIWSFVWP